MAMEQPSFDQQAGEFVGTYFGDIQKHHLQIDRQETGIRVRGFTQSMHIAGRILGDFKDTAPKLVARMNELGFRDAYCDVNDSEEGGITVNFGFVIGKVEETKRQIKEVYDEPNFEVGC